VGHCSGQHGRILRERGGWRWRRGSAAAKGVDSRANSGLRQLRRGWGQPALRGQVKSAGYYGVGQLAEQWRRAWCLA
jgi:hypothetical protein